MKKLFIIFILLVSLLVIFLCSSCDTSRDKYSNDEVLALIESKDATIVGNKTVRLYMVDSIYNAPYIKIRNIVYYPKVDYPYIDNIIYTKVKVY